MKVLPDRRSGSARQQKPGNGLIQASNNAITFPEQFDRIQGERAALVHGDS
jgi:hypothetical protein